MSQSQTAERNQHVLAIKCHWCGHRGSSLWEKTPAGREIMSLEGFSERLTNKQPFEIETVCNGCNKTQPI